MSKKLDNALQDLSVKSTDPITSSAEYSNLVSPIGKLAAYEINRNIMESIQSPLVDSISESIRRTSALTQPRSFSPSFEKLFESMNSQMQLREAILSRHLNLQDHLTAAMQPLNRFSRISDLLSPFVLNWASTTMINYDRLFSTINKSLAWELSDHLQDLWDEHRADLLLEFGLHFLLDATDDEISDLTSEVVRLAADARSAEVTKHIHRATCSEDFGRTLFANLDALPNLRGRKRIINAAIQAHANRNYLLSIPALLPQVEALTTHLLAKAGYVKWNRSKRKWCQVDPASRKYLRRGPKNRIATVNGLGSLEEVIKQLEDSPMPEGLPYLQTELARYRNGVLHGNLIKYDKPRESSKLLLLIQLLAANLVSTDRTETS